MYQYNPNMQNTYQYVPNNEGISTSQQPQQQGQSEELSFQQFEYSQKNPIILELMTKVKEYLMTFK
jgi:hypothetical protein